jgi:very-short-patch-repair endonuclease
MTVAERRLWSRLRAGRFYGLRWLRQEPLDPFVTGYRAAEDERRESRLKEQGLTGVRYPNWAVLSDVDGVLEHLLFFCRGHLPETE